jgi:hypothetical protein
MRIFATQERRRRLAEGNAAALGARLRFISGAVSMTRVGTSPQLSRKGFAWPFAALG